MSKEKVAPIPDGPLARYLAEHQGWAATKDAHEQTEPRPLRYQLNEQEKRGGREVWARFGDGPRGAALEISAYIGCHQNYCLSPASGGSWVSLSLAEAERLRICLNETMGTPPYPGTQTPP